MKTFVETWTSDQNQEERHFFVSGDPAKYLLGFNPAYFSEADVVAFMREKLAATAEPSSGLSPDDQREWDRRGRL